jgi:hypothetical protein
MDWNRIEGSWKELKGKIKQQWGNVTDDDRRDRLVIVKKSARLIRGSSLQLTGAAIGAEGPARVE